jgi:hypothetical protein
MEAMADQHIPTSVSDCHGPAVEEEVELHGLQPSLPSAVSVNATGGVAAGDESTERLLQHHFGAADGASGDSLFQFPSQNLIPPTR